MFMTTFGTKNIKSHNLLMAHSTRLELCLMSIFECILKVEVQMNTWFDMLKCDFFLIFVATFSNYAFSLSFAIMKSSRPILLVTINNINFIRAHESLFMPTCHLVSWNKRIMKSKWLEKSLKKMVVVVH